MDPRVEKLADIMVNYSLELKEGEWVKVRGIPNAMPLVKAFYRKALEAGAHPFYSAIIDDLEEIFYKYASEEQLRFISKTQKMEVEHVDALFAISARENTRFLAGVDPQKQAITNAAHKGLFKKFMERSSKKELKWCGTMYPVLSAAQDAEMSLTDYENFVYNAGHLNDDDPVAFWKNMSSRQDKICDYLNTLDEIHVMTKDTDLKLNVNGRKWINCDGKNNFPDGEVFTSPIEDSAQGHIHYSFPACYQGREVENVHLEFENGKVVNFSADKNKEFLGKMIGIDDGASFLGEFAIGTNYNIQKFTKNTLFDEKIGGTIHLALGAAPPETGSKNESGIHWDMVCDLRNGGEIYADGDLIYKEGKLVKEF